MSAGCKKFIMPSVCENSMTIVYVHRDCTCNRGHLICDAESNVEKVGAGPLLDQLAKYQAFCLESHGVRCSVCVFVANLRAANNPGSS